MMMTKFFDCELDGSVEGKTDPFELKGELMCKWPHKRSPLARKDYWDF